MGSGTIGGETTNTAEVEKKFVNLIHKKLVEKFGDEFVFGPILVQASLDLDGIPACMLKKCSRGTRKKQDPAWKADLPCFLWPHAEARGGLPVLPLQSFVRKSNWPHLQEKIP